MNKQTYKKVEKILKQYGFLTLNFK